MEAHTYRIINLCLWGLNSQVAEEAIAILHDRRVEWKLSWFVRINATISSRLMKTKTDYTVNGATASSTTLDWKKLTTIRCVQDALLSFQICLSLVWPLDLMGMVLLKVLNDDHISVELRSVSGSRSSRAYSSGSPTQTAKGRSEGNHRLTSRKYHRSSRSV